MGTEKLNEFYEFPILNQFRILDLKNLLQDKLEKHQLLNSYQKCPLVAYNSYLVNILQTEAEFFKNSDQKSFC